MDGRRGRRAAMRWVIWSVRSPKSLDTSNTSTSPTNCGGPGGASQQFFPDTTRPWMMDPLSAFSTAAAVVQFVDFGYRLVKGAHELYTSPVGQKSEYIELSVVSQDLSNLADAVKAKLGENAGPPEEVLRICRECASTNDELQQILRKLKAQGDTKFALAADSWRVALRQATTAGDIEKLADRLSQIREQMNVALLYLLLSVVSPHAGANTVCTYGYIYIYIQCNKLTWLP